MGRYNDNIQRVTKNKEYTSLLSGDEFKTVLGNAKSMERTVKDLKPKNNNYRAPLSQNGYNTSNNALNWRSSPPTVEAGGATGIKTINNLKVDQATAGLPAPATLQATGHTQRGGCTHNPNLTSRGDVSFS